MKPEIKKLWIDSLPKYKQNYHSLRDMVGDKYCVMGVLCDLHSKRKIKGKKTPNWEGNTYLGKATEVPTEVLKWSGVSFDDSCNLIYLNDKYVPFDELTKVIEEI